MLCELVEKGRSKCCKYWPSEVGQTIITHPTGLLVRNISTSFKEGVMIVTKLEVFQLNKNVENSATKLITVKHIKWNDWPDRGVPEFQLAPFRLLRRVLNISPVSIHCSAGNNFLFSFLLLS